jgi:hypothetical protein
MVARHILVDYFRIGGHQVVDFSTVRLNVL